MGRTYSFRFFLIDFIKPKLFVELGVHVGNSYNAFCQAVKTFNTSTICYGIDTWKRDKHVGFYDEFVYDELMRYQKKNYGEFSL